MSLTDGGSSFPARNPAPSCRTRNWEDVRAEPCGMSTSRFDDTRPSKSNAAKLHDVTAGRPITYETSGHPPRADSPTYRASRSALAKIVKSVQGWYFAGKRYQDHRRPHLSNARDGHRPLQT